MKDYYKLLDLEDFRKENEEELRRTLDFRIRSAYMFAKELDQYSEEYYNDHRIELLHKKLSDIKDFKKILDEIGKENYDKELEKYHKKIEKTMERIEKNKKKVTVFGKIPKKTKIVMAGVLAGTVIFTSAITYSIKNSGRQVNIVVPSDTTLSTTTEPKIDGIYSFEYTVEPGDTVWNLQERFSAVSITNKYGKETGNDINAGDIIEIHTFHPEAFYNYLSEQANSVYNVTTYKVQNGDTLIDVAKKFNVSIDSLLMFNPEIRDINQIHEGQIINIPVKELKQDAIKTK